MSTEQLFDVLFNNYSFGVNCIILHQIVLNYRNYGLIHSYLDNRRSIGRLPATPLPPTPPPRL